MSHLHVPDGVLPGWVAAAALLLAAAAVLGVLRLHRGADGVRFRARVGVGGAALLVVMSIPLGPGLHLSLAPLAGMLLGPGGGFLAAFLASASLASLGHGGVTAAGLNGLFLGAQAAAGAGAFALLRRPLGVRWGAVAATAVTLLAAAAGALAALRLLPVDPDGDAPALPPGGWRLWLVAGLALLAAAAETALTASVVAFLARVRRDLLPGGAAA